MYFIISRAVSTLRCIGVLSLSGYGFVSVIGEAWRQEIDKIELGSLLSLCQKGMHYSVHGLSASMYGRIRHPRSKPL